MTAIYNLTTRSADPVAPLRRLWKNNWLRNIPLKITTDHVDVPAPDGGHIRTSLAAPQPIGKYPGILCYSDIFQLTGPMLRSCARLAGYGFVVAAPEISRRLEPPGLVIPFDDAGRTRGLQD